MLKKISVAIVVMALAACSAQQAAKVEADAQKVQTGIQTVVQVGCELDGRFVPIGQDAASVIAPVVGATKAAAGTLLMSAVAADKAIVHPTVVAVCKSLLGSQAGPAVQVVPMTVIPLPAAAPAAAAPVAVKPGA